MRCPLCNSDEMYPIAERGSVPVLQNVLCGTREKAESFPRGRITFFQCANCHFVSNTSYEQVSYEEDYENYQGCSDSFSNYMDERARRIASCADSLQGSVLLVEIGCGQGVFLQRILHHVTRPCDGLGFDPAYRGKATIGRMRFVPQYFAGGGNKVLSQTRL